MTCEPTGERYNGQAMVDCMRSLNSATDTGVFLHDASTNHPQFIKAQT
ncbi:hypothetical protein MGWOODY_XGa1810 [hydrothermal vent metagenome]|uniref:Uncharacterized protein n=1 Tax=hydrothermal vent metagenome TaxID=652676 RepID=A0A160TU06_9ZZZZ